MYSDSFLICGPAALDAFCLYSKLFYCSFCNEPEMKSFKNNSVCAQILMSSFHFPSCRFGLFLKKSIVIGPVAEVGNISVAALRGSSSEEQLEVLGSERVFRFHFLPLTSSINVGQI